MHVVIVSIVDTFCRLKKKNVQVVRLRLDDNFFFINFKNHVLEFETNTAAD